MLQYVVAPVFFALALINYRQPYSLCAAANPGPWAFLTSMWLMYIVMGVAHCAPWLELLTKRLKRFV